MLVAALALAARADAQELPGAPLPAAVSGQWLAGVSSFVDRSEREVYRGLTSEAERESFRRAFWLARDPTPRTLLNEAKEELEFRLSETRARGLLPPDQRALAMLLLGVPPLRIHHGDCGGTPRFREHRELVGDCVVARPFELLDYGPRARRVRPPVLFVQRGGECVLFDRDEMPAFHFIQAPSGRCSHARNLTERLSAALDAQVDWDWMRGHGPLPRARTDWLATWSPDEVARPARPAGEPRLLLRGQRPPEDDRDPAAPWRLSTTLEIPIEAGWWNGTGLWRHLHLRIDLYHDGALISGADRWTTYTSSPGQAIEEELELDAPLGTHVIVVRAEDEAGDLVSVRAFALEVSSSGVATREAVGEPVSKAPSPRTVDGHGVLALARRPWIELAREPLEGMLVGPKTVLLAAWSPEIVGVELLLDGESVGRSSRPPFSFEVDLGAVPREREIEARGFTANTTSRAAAVDRALLNLGAQRFAIDLQEVGSAAGGPPAVRGQVAVPAGAVLDRVELSDGEGTAETVREPVFSWSPPAPAAGQSSRPVALLHATAFLRDGRQREETLVLASQRIEKVDVDLVELYARAVDRRGRPVTDLAAEEITVLEDGRAQALRSFRRVERLPLDVVLLLDTSQSMEEEIGQVRASGIAFLEQVLRTGDRAALMTFKHRIHQSVPFTGDLGLLREGMLGMRAWGGTSLVDSLVLALYSMGGIEGRSALVVLSDGADESSEVERRDLLELVERADVAIYTLGLGVPAGDRQARRLLAEVARRSGGATYDIERVEDLETAYRAIESALRSQYLLTYESSGAETSDRSGYRSIRIEVARRGQRMIARTGYYP